MISALISWFVGTTVIVTMVVGFLTVPPASTVNAAPEPTPPSQDCLSCHARVLKGHDKLGSGSEACWVCHDSADMTKLHFIDGTPLSLSDSPQLCGQCHHKRYDAWKEGTHGIPGAAERAKCTSCHDPHQPQIALLDITKSHPAPAPPPPPPAVEPLIMLGISLLIAIGIGVMVATRGEGL